MASLHLSPTNVNDCVLIDSPIFRDDRGMFAEAFQIKHFGEIGLPTVWPQDNISSSQKLVIRGLHIQRKNPQGKLVRCTNGLIWDVCLDLRPLSPTFMKHHAVMLYPGRAMYLPPGTAHGFLALEPHSSIYYKCTTLYDRDTDGGVNPFDPELNIKWPAPEIGAIMSEKDRALPMAAKWLEDPRGTWNE